MSGKPLGQLELHPAIRHRIQEQHRLLQLARRYARRLSTVLPVQWAIVAGSVARGDFHAGSDIDVLVVSDALPAGPLERAELLYQCAEGGVEPKGFSRQELLEALRRRNPLVVEAVQRGVLIYPHGSSLGKFRQWLGLEE